MWVVDGCFYPEHVAFVIHLDTVGLQPEFQFPAVYVDLDMERKPCLELDKQEAFGNVLFLVLGGRQIYDRTSEFLDRTFDLFRKKGRKIAVCDHTVKKGKLRRSAL